MGQCYPEVTDNEVSILPAHLLGFTLELVLGVEVTDQCLGRSSEAPIVFLSFLLLIFIYSAIEVYGSP